MGTRGASSLHSQDPPWQELSGCRVAAVLTADTQFQLCFHRAALLRGHLHQLSHPDYIKGSGRDPSPRCPFPCSRRGTGIVPAEPEGHLGQVVGTEGEEVSLSCNLVSG